MGRRWVEESWAEGVANHTVSFECNNKKLGATDAWEDKLVQEFRSFTSQGEAAEAFIRMAFTLAAATKAPEGSRLWEIAFESVSVDSTQFLIADEKLKTALMKHLDVRMSSRWALRAKERRQLGRAATGGWQLLFFILSFYSL